MNKPVVQLGPDAVKQVAKTVREHSRRIVNERPVRQRWQQQQPNQGCVRSYVARLWWNPSAATMTLQVRYNSVTENISIARTDDAAAVKAAIDAHSEFVAASVECTVTGSGEMWQGNKLIVLPAGASIVGHSATMTRRSIYDPNPEFTVDICGCTGSVE